MELYEMTNYIKKTSQNIQSRLKNNKRVNNLDCYDTNCWKLKNKIKFKKQDCLNAHVYVILRKKESNFYLKSDS